MTKLEKYEEMKKAAKQWCQVQWNGLLVKIDNLQTPRRGVVAGAVGASVLWLILVLLGLWIFSGNETNTTSYTAPIMQTAPAPTEHVNLVTGIMPVRPVTPPQLSILNRLAGLTAAQQNELLQREWPTLSSDLVGWLRADARIQNDEEVTKVELFYGSATAKGEDLDGVVHDGHFENELLAVIAIKGRPEPMIVAVKCTNGMYDIVRGDLSLIGEGSLKFTIGKGDSLVNYVSFPAAINLANVHGLTIQAGRGKDLHEVSAAEALTIDTAKTLVRVLVYEGDHFNLGDMTYTPAN